MSIMQDAYYAYGRAYVYWDYKKKILYPMDKYSPMFNEILTHPELYIKKRDKVKEYLKKLKEKGKKLFLATDSLCDFSKFVMNYAFGKDWKDLFDLRISSCNKPNFFKCTDQVCFKTDETKPVYWGDKVQGPLEPNNDYILGNFSDVVTTFEKMLGKKDIKYVYVGCAMQQDNDPKQMSKSTSD